MINRFYFFSYQLVIKIGKTSYTENCLADAADRDDNSFHVQHNVVLLIIK